MTRAEMPDDVREAHAHCGLNRGELTQSSVCGCFHCCSIFGPTQIRDWIDPAPEMAKATGTQGRTARCPRCGIDSVIGDRSGYPITPDFLAKMRTYWF
ncbi:cytoplasmic protein [Mycobacterium branderi]|uniref:cytoplasmic protein n=1 Tax=Mycobacterium branderi TaxID=43348 RepID=UPI001B80DF5F|nr:cytoplasmic protein [Mycobacterium branderi]